MRQDPDFGRHQQPAQWQIPRQRVPLDETGPASPGDREPDASWQPFSRPISDLTNPVSQRTAAPAAGRRPPPPMVTAAPGRTQRPFSRMKAISLALAVAAALVFLVSLADRQLSTVTAAVTAVLMLAALTNYQRLARKRD